MRLRLVGGSVLFAAILTLPNVSLATSPPPAETGSLPLAVDAAAPMWQSEPIELEATAVGLSWGDQPAPANAWVRASENGTDWGPWVALEEDADHAPDGAEVRRSRPGTDPVYVGEARYVQFQVEGAAAGLEAEYVETAGRNLNLAEKVERFFKRIRFFRSNPVQAQPDQPAMISRAEWGGDACLGGAQPDRTYVNRVQMMFVHHTSTSAAANSYSPAEAKERIYATCAYHVNVRGWDDIGYNYVIDRFGTIYEGRGGGYGVQGAHTKGFNAYSAGVAFLGYHETAAPTPEAQQALTTLASWVLDVAHVDPLATTTVTSNGSTLYDEGVVVTFPTIAGHRDAGVTSCPGTANYAQLGAYRQSIAANPDPKIYGGWPSQDPVPGFPDTGYEPAVFSFRFTEPMTWTFTIVDETVVEMLAAQGSGTDGSVTWDGTFAGVIQPIGTYRSSLQAVPISGTPPPRPAVFDFHLGLFNPPFSDDDESVFEPDIGTIYTAGITKGCGPDLYCPDDIVTRGQMALFLTRLWTMSNYDLPPGADMGFVDIAGMSPEMQVAINQLAELGVTTGIGPGLYGPADPVNRWQMALFLTRLWTDAGGALPVAIGAPFTDISSLPLDVQTAINDLAAIGITSGTGPGTYDPSGLVTRGQMAAFLARTMNGLGWGPVVS